MLTLSAGVAITANAQITRLNGSDRYLTSSGIMLPKAMILQ
ncbi:hypothetical protein [Clostridium sp. CF012]|nr:hypothetical protein [Clostridium sp. CF012]